MKTQVACFCCHRVLGNTSDGILPIVFPMAVNVEAHQMMFTIQCPDCGKVNHVKMMRDDQTEVHNY